MKISLIGSCFQGQLHSILDSFHFSGDYEDKMVVFDPPGTTILKISTEKIIEEVNEVNGLEKISYSQKAEDLKNSNYMVFLGINLPTLTEVQQATISSKLFSMVFAQENLNPEGIYFGGEHLGFLNASILVDKFPQFKDKVVVFSGVEYRGRKRLGGSASSKVMALTANKRIVSIKEETEDVTDQFQHWIGPEYPFYDSKMIGEVVRCCLDGETIPSTYKGVFEDSEENEQEFDDDSSPSIPRYVYSFQNEKIQDELNRIGRGIKSEITGIVKEAFPREEEMSD